MRVGGRNGRQAGRQVEVCGQNSRPVAGKTRLQLGMAPRPGGSLVAGRRVLADIVLLGGSKRVKLSTSWAASRPLQVLHALEETERR